MHGCYFRLYAAYKLASNDVKVVERALAKLDPCSLATFGLSPGDSAADRITDITAQMVASGPLARPAAVWRALETLQRVLDELAISAAAVDTQALLRSVRSAERTKAKLIALEAKNQAAVEYIAAKRLRPEEQTVIDQIYAVKLKPKATKPQ
jgi:carbamoylphosphate synthase small subunit